MIRFIILGLLNIKPMSAYDFDKILSNSIKSFYDIKQSHVYIEFKKLEADGFLASETIVTEANRTKKVFHITEKGKEFFHDKNNSLDKAPERYLDIRALFLVRMFFGEFLDDESNINFLQSLKTQTIHKIKETKDKQAIIENAPSKHSNIRNKWYWNSTAEFGLSFYRLLLEWIDSCIEDIDAKVWEK